jgi:hypothetical protein
MIFRHTLIIFIRFGKIKYKPLPLSFLLIAMIKNSQQSAVHPSILIKSLHPDSVSHPAAIRLAQALQR